MRLSVSFLGAVLLLPVVLAAQGTAVPRELTFADALRIAETANPTFRAARNLVDVAEADAREAGSRPNPIVAMEGEGYSAFTPRERSFWNDQALTLRFTQEIETAGRRAHRVRAAHAGVEVARSEVADARRQLHRAIGRGYFRLALAQADRATAAAALDELEQVIALTAARFAAGEVAGIELRRLQVERLNFVDRVFAIDLAVSDARVALLGLLGASDLRQPIEAVDPLPAPPLLGADGRLIATADGVPVELERLRADAAAGRPDLTAARRARERAETEIELQRALRTPNVTAGWGYRRRFGTHAMDFEVGIPVPLFGSLNPGGVQRANAAHRRAQALESAAVVAVDVELQQAVNAVEINAQRVRYIEQEYIRSVEETRDIVRASYEFGESALIDFLDAQRELLATQQVHNRALYDLRISLIELAAAVGVAPAGRP